MEIMRADRLTWTLRRMSRYGVLGRYLPAFGRIVGQMQHDLFHVYTVDEHILMVIRNLRRFRIPRFDHEYPFLSKLMQEFDRPRCCTWRRSSTTSPRGAAATTRTWREDAERFCRAHGLRKRRRRPGRVAGRAPPRDVVDRAEAGPRRSRGDLGFATLVRDERTLTALYILTVADIRGTSPAVWNAWKGKLLEDLFRYTRRVLRGETDYAASWIAAKKRERCASSASTCPSPASTRAVEAPRRQLLPALRGERDRLAHAHALERGDARQADRARAPVAVGEGLQVLVYAPDQPGLFARITGFFERMQFDVVAAKIYTTQHGFALDTSRCSRARARASTTATSSARSTPSWRSSSRRTSRSRPRPRDACRAG
jgi:[protein-PII] uridylyltransferase